MLAFALTLPLLFIHVFLDLFMKIKLTIPILKRILFGIDQKLEYIHLPASSKAQISDSKNQSPVANGIISSVL